MRYVFARLKQKQREEAYRIYLTDGVKVLCDNLQHAFGGGTISVRYYDLVEREKEEQKSGKEIADELIAKMGLKLKDTTEEVTRNGCV